MDIPMVTSCASLIVDLFLFCNETDYDCLEITMNKEELQQKYCFYNGQRKICWEMIA